MRNNCIRTYRDLKRDGWELSNTPSIKFNAGGKSETDSHIVGKTLAAKVCLENDYMVDTEVSHTKRGCVDVLAYAPDRLVRVIELETDVSEDVIADKLSRYVNDSPVVDELHVIETNSLGANVFDMRDTICSELGFYEQ